ncbi:putative apc amino acid permease [Lyophyllum shimeji]|uniref:Apc amino acid permease n=1 Tax=Lyophyllum shimeji TaxID=47721 RepID=A0A9P3PN06_LYOSH|nr:putative apc amino acid permease [Lyophyllum shimeji]
MEVELSDDSCRRFLSRKSPLLHQIAPSLLKPEPYDAIMSSVNSSPTRRLPDDHLAATPGYKQEFKRKFTSLEIFGVSFPVIALVPSIASVLFNSIPNGGGPAMVWGWAVASLFMLLVAISMAELASAVPSSGGLYFWTYSLSSPRWRGFLCWIVGNANTIGCISAFASIDWGCAEQIMAVATFGSEYAVEGTAAQIFGLYSAIVLTHIALCCLGTTAHARLQVLYLVLNVLLCLVIVIALPLATPNKNTAKFALWDFTNINGWPDSYAFILSLLAPLWTIGSPDVGGPISDEASNAATAVPWAIVLATFGAGVLGWAINVSLAFCMGTDLRSLYDSGRGQPMAQILSYSFGRKGTLAVWAMIVVVQYMMGTSMLLVASHQTFLLSRDSTLPFSAWLYKINRFTGTPVNAVVFNDAVFSLSIIPWYIALAIPIAARFLGANTFKPGPFSLGIFSLPVAVVSLSFMLVVSFFFLFPTSPNPTAEEMNYTVVVLGLAMALSIAWYYFPRYGGVHWFTGPVLDVDLESGSKGNS